VTLAAQDAALQLFAGNEACMTDARAIIAHPTPWRAMPVGAMGRP
jgi:hypothetical protein